MSEITSYAKLCLNYTVAGTGISKKIDSQLGVHGITLSEYMILFHLNMAKNKKMRRIDLAEKVGLSASGITRLVNPMVRIGLVHKEAVEHDARVSLVKISDSGERILLEATDTLNFASDEIFSKVPGNNLEVIIESLNLLGGNIK